MRRMIRTTMISLTFITGLITTTTTFASNLSAGSWILRGGASRVVPDEDTGGVNGPLSPAMNGAHVSVDSDTKFSVTLAYMVTDHIDLELLGAAPFKHHAEISGGALDGADLGSIKHLPPTLSLDYHFDTGTPITPYIGAGVNWTIFFDEDIAGDARGAGVKSLELSNSVGPAGQIGVDWELPYHLLLNANVRYIDIDTNAHVKTAGGGNTKVNLDIDPWIYTLALGYRF
ncbi:OmpW/AlkL family protein [Salinisphaera orenii]|uniref:OmpW/AlkL family protein n=1 Tax=Salinisphaera orenii TaxID=856731 RepID=UPI000DBE2A96